MEKKNVIKVAKKTATVPEKSCQNQFGIGTITVKRGGNRRGRNRLCRYFARLRGLI